jgi:hypothetical protein
MAVMTGIKQFRPDFEASAAAGATGLPGAEGVPAFEPVNAPASTVDRSEAGR